jgi:hypothetical protein
MSNYNWCHGPNCHTIETKSRIRGSGDNKVLRTIKIGLDNDNYRTRYPEYSMWQYFCNQGCLFDFIRTHLQSIVAIAPRREALETPIQVEVERFKNYRMRYNGENYEKIPFTSTRTTIKSVDNDNG